MLCGVLIEDYEWSSLVKIGYITVTCGLTPSLYIMGMQGDTAREDQGQNKESTGQLGELSSSGSAQALRLSDSGSYSVTVTVTQSLG